MQSFSFIESVEDAIKNFHFSRQDPFFSHPLYRAPFGERRANRHFEVNFARRSTATAHSTQQDKKKKRSEYLAIRVIFARERRDREGGRARESEREREGLDAKCRRRRKLSSSGCKKIGTRRRYNFIIRVVSCRRNRL